VFSQLQKKKEKNRKGEKLHGQKRKKYTTLTETHRDSSGSIREGSGNLEKLPLMSFSNESMQKGENLSLAQVPYCRTRRRKENLREMGCMWTGSMSL
jgi:hypothetical protein